MVRGLFAAVIAVPAVLVPISFNATPAHAAVVNVDLTLAPEDFTRGGFGYRSGSGSSAYDESIEFSTPAGAVNPGDAVSVRLTFARPVRLENFYAGEDYRAEIALRRGPQAGGSNQSLTATLTPIDPADLSVTTFKGGSLSTIEGGAVEHLHVAGLTPSADYGQLGGFEWTYTAPAWTPANTEMSLDFSLSFITRRVSPTSLPDPGRHLITFVPEPAAATLLLVLPALTLTARPRRRR